MVWVCTLGDVCKPYLQTSDQLSQAKQRLIQCEDRSHQVCYPFLLSSIVGCDHEALSIDAWLKPSFDHLGWL